MSTILNNLEQCFLKISMCFLFCFPIIIRIFVENINNN